VIDLSDTDDHTSNQEESKTIGPQQKRPRAETDDLEVRKQLEYSDQHDYEEEQFNDSSRAHSIVSNRTASAFHEGQEFDMKVMNWIQDYVDRPATHLKKEEIIMQDKPFSLNELFKVKLYPRNRNINDLELSSF